MTDSSAISVIVQGAIDWSHDPTTDQPLIIAACKAIRTLLPRAELILSTWQDPSASTLPCDIIIQSIDPGGQGHIGGFTPNNINRQITSTVAGLRAATRQLALKIRTDIILKNLTFLHVWDNLRPIQSPLRVFDRPLIANYLSSRNSRAILERLPDHPLLFHPSDHVHFGQKVDLLALWDVPMQTEQDALHFLTHVRPNRWRDHELSRLTPEQHIFTHAIAKVCPQVIGHYADSTSYLAKASEHFLLTHFYHIQDKLYSIRFPKYHTKQHFSFDWMRRIDTYAS